MNSAEFEAERAFFRSAHAVAREVDFLIYVKTSSPYLERRK